MVRAEGGRLFDAYLAGGFVSLGWATARSAVGMDRDTLRAAIATENPGMCESLLVAGTGMVRRFAAQPELGDGVITYHPPTRRYAIGEIISDYVFDPTFVLPLASKRHTHLRHVLWRGLLPRTGLPEAARNALQPTISFFQVRPEAEAMIERAFETHAEPLPARA